MLKNFLHPKTPEPIEFWTTSATVPGYEHVEHKMNCQDQAFSGTFVFSGKIYRFGGSLDGNGKGENSEFGAILAKDYFLNAIPHFISAGVALSQLPQLLFDGLTMELYKVLPGNRNPKELDAFIRSKLLFTVFAFVQGPDDTIVFYLGDGIVVVNSQVLVGKERKIAAENQPDYLALALLQKVYPSPLFRESWASGKKIRIPYQPKTQFEVITVKTKDLEQLWVGSDAWHDEEELLKKFMELLPTLDPGYPEDIQDQMTAWSGIPFRDPGNQEPIHFSDDASVSILQRIHPKTSGDKS